MFLGLRTRQRLHVRICSQQEARTPQEQLKGNPSAASENRRAFERLKGAQSDPGDRGCVNCVVTGSDNRQSQILSTGRHDPSDMRRDHLLQHYVIPSTIKLDDGRGDEARTRGADGMALINNELRRYHRIKAMH